MEITTLTMYLFTRLDKIVYTCQCITQFSAAVFVLSIVIRGLITMDDSLYKALYNVCSICKKLLIIAPITFIIFGMFSILIPTQKEFAAIYIIPKVVNNEKIQNISNKSLNSVDNLIELSNQWLKEKMKVNHKND